MIWLFFAAEIILIVILSFILSSILFSSFTEAPFVPTGRRSLRRIIDLAAIKPGEIFYDLGSGDGRFVIAAARQGAMAYGLEKSWPLVFWSRFLIWIFGLKNKALIKRLDFFKADLSQADVIFCYLLPEPMEGLKIKFERELKPGARVLSRAFKIPGREPIIIQRFGKWSPSVYLYKY